MSDRLAPSASRLCGLVCRNLGWRPGDFWAATPAEIACVLSESQGASPALDAAELQRLLERLSDG